MCFYRIYIFPPTAFFFIFCCMKLFHYLVRISYIYLFYTKYKKSNRYTVYLESRYDCSIFHVVYLHNILLISAACDVKMSYLTGERDKIELSCDAL